jgi:hypothetical protein
VVDFFGEQRSERRENRDVGVVNLFWREERVNFEHDVGRKRRKRTFCKTCTICRRPREDFESA